MSRATTREVVQLCTELAKLDRRSKQVVYDYLGEELARVVEEKKKVTYKDGMEK